MPGLQGGVDPGVVLVPAGDGAIQPVKDAGNVQVGGDTVGPTQFPDQAGDAADALDLNVVEQVAHDVEAVPCYGDRDVAEGVGPGVHAGDGCNDV